MSVGLVDDSRMASRIGYVAANLWLLFLLFPLLSALATDMAGWRKVGVVVVIALFAAAHSLGYRQMIRSELGLDTPVERADGRWSALGAREMWFAAMVVLTVVGVAIGGWSMLGVTPFLVSYGFFNFEWRTGAIIFAATMAAVVVPPAIGGVLDELWFFPIIVASVGVGAALVGFSEERVAERAVFDKQLALSDERQRVARDVHDVLGHSLTAVILKGQVIDRMLDRLDPDADDDRQLLASARVQLAELDTVSRRALAEIRSTVGGLRSADLADEITAARAVLADAGVTLTVTGDAGRVPDGLRPVLGWVVREAVTNVVRHARAENCEIALGEEADDEQAETVVLRVTDDGVGLSGAEGNGLSGLRERVAASGAQVRVGASAVGGTMVEVVQ